MARGNIDEAISRLEQAKWELTKYKKYPLEEDSTRKKYLQQASVNINAARIFCDKVLYFPDTPEQEKTNVRRAKSYRN